MHERRANRRSDKGQATVEFALILIVLLAVLYGILEISRLLLVSAQIQNAAKEGAHYASLHPGVDKGCIQRNAIEPRMALVDTSATYISVGLTRSEDAPGVPLQVGSAITVTVAYTWTSFVNIMPDMGSLTLRPLGPLRFEGQAVDIIENPGVPSTTCP